LIPALSLCRTQAPN